MFVRRIGKDQGVFAVFMLEEIEDAFIFADAGQKGEIRFVVLNTIVLGPIAAQIQAVVDLGINAFLSQHGLAENVFDDFRDGFVLKNTAVVTTGQQPQRRFQGCGIPAQTVGSRGLRRAEGDDNAVNIAFGAVG